MSYELRCGWCKKVKDAPGWHDCPQAKDGRERLGDVLLNIDELMRGGQEKWDDPDEQVRRKFTKATFDKLENQ